MKKKLSKSKHLNTSIYSKNNNSLRNFKRSQSEVISTVLLILLVVVASVILIAFVVPLVKKFLEPAKCNDYTGKISITNNEKYSCYDSAGKRLLLQLRIDNSLEKSSVEALTGIHIVLETTGSDSKSFDIIPPGSNPPMSVVMGDGGLALAIPGLKRTEITYNISNIDLRPNATTIFPILNNSQTCANTAYTLNYIPFCK